MAEIIDEKISVNLWNTQPVEFIWKNRNYKIAKIGLHHTFREGRVLMHVFSATDGATFFKLQFDTETLLWKLIELDYV